ncbi:MAG: DUF2177 family protein [Caulobacteraceae bacterium]
MIRWIGAWLAAAATFGVLDAAWLGAAYARLYRPELHAILAEHMRWAPAALFYILYLTGLTIFAVAPALRARRWATATVMGAIFGLVAYATYDLTNQATLAIWSARVTSIDLAWGAFASAAAATAGYFAGKSLRAG